MVEVSIPRGVGSVANIFAALQLAHAEHQIDCYSVSQTTLDTVSGTEHPFCWLFPAGCLHMLLVINLEG